jgi:U3 small nucleolar RNA-associated protein 7
MEKQKTKRYFKSEDSKPNLKQTFKHKNKKFKNPFHGKSQKSEITNKKLQPEVSQVSEEQLKKYSRGSEATQKGLKTKFFKTKIVRNESKIKYAVHQSAKIEEYLLKEEEGFLVPDDGEETTEYSQADIAENVDIISASKHFKLNLDQFGPYRINYTRNGRHLLLGGKQGHLAALDWVSKKLHCEFNAMEEIFDVQWLHVETMFAAAQKKWVHFYDKKGTEVHCVKKMGHVNCLEFLPYHFLLAAGNNDGYLKWLDVSIGEMVAQYKTSEDRITIMKQNPANAVICVGNPKGVVSMWAPSVKRPLAKILCHGTAITALAFHPSGDLMVTAGIDKAVKVWDTRNMREPLVNYKLRTSAKHLEISQRSVLAVSLGNVCEIFRNQTMSRMTTITSYLHHIEDSVIEDLQFVPFEDVLGIGTKKGFSSILVPGSGEPNFDALESNPFRTKSQRREHEVHSLLEKIPSELITLDQNEILGVDRDALQKNLENRIKVPGLKQPEHYQMTSKRNVSGVKKNKVKKQLKEQANQVSFLEILS